MRIDKSRGTKPRTQIKDVPRGKKELSNREQKNVKGGLLPYIEQDNRTA
jgi:hypothetical protein